LPGAPQIQWSSNLAADLYLPQAPGDHIVIAQSAYAVAAVDRETGNRLWHESVNSSSASPVLADGVAYVGSLDGLSALDARTGEPIWTFVPIRDPELTAPDGYPPLTIVDAPVAVVDGIVYVSGGIYGGLWALDAQSGSLVWSVDTHGGMPAAVSVAEGTVVFSTEVGGGYAGLDADTAVSALYAVDAATGDLLWKTDFPPGFTALGVPMVLGDHILVGLTPVAGANVGSWNAYDWATGELRWSVPAKTPPYGANPAGKDNVLFIPGAEATGMMALDAVTGKVIWQHETESAVFWGSLVIGDVLYIRTEAPSVEALDTATGALLWSIPTGDPGQGPNSGLSYSDGVLYTGSGPFLYAIDGDGGAAPEPGESAIVSAPTVDPNAASFLTWSGTLKTPEAFDGPNGIAVRPNGEIFIDDTKNDRVLIFGPDGTFERTWDSLQGGGPAFNFHEPDGYFIGDLEFDSAGNLYMTNAGMSSVEIYDKDLHFVDSIRLPSDDLGDPSRPGGIAVDEANNRIYVTDFAHNHVFVFDLDGKLISTWGPAGSDVELPLGGPVGIAIGPDGNVYVADPARNRIRIVTPDGAPVATWGSSGSGIGQFAGLSTIEIDAAGNVYAADYGGDRLQVFAPDGRVIGVFGEPGNGDGQFLQPTFMAFLPDGRLLVSDETTNRIVILSTQGAPPPASPVASPAA
jgi:outer membrane protein assembly factor BamB